MKKGTTFLPLMGTGSGRHGKKWKAHWASLPSYEYRDRLLGIYDCEIEIWSRKAGQCEACGCKIEVDQRIYWVPQTHMARHAGCTSARYEELVADHEAQVAAARIAEQKQAKLDTLRAAARICQRHANARAWLKEEIRLMDAADTPPVEHVSGDLH